MFSIDNNRNRSFVQSKTEKMLGFSAKQIKREKALKRLGLTENDISEALQRKCKKKIN